MADARGGHQADRQALLGWAVGGGGKHLDSDIMRKTLHTCIANQAYDEMDQYPAREEAKGIRDGQHEAAMEKKTVGCPL